MTYRYTNDGFEELNNLYKSITGYSGYDSKYADTGDVGRIAYAMHFADKLKAGMTQTVREGTRFYQDARKLDNDRSGTYWSTDVEMFARAFSAFIEDKLKSEGRKSEYLSYGSSNDLYDWGIESPFPGGEERERINKAFQSFFDEMKHETDEKGNVRLYSLRKDKDTGKVGGKYGTDGTYETDGTLKSDMSDDSDLSDKGEVRYSLRKQVNPIIDDAEEYLRYQEVLNNNEYEVKHNAELERQAAKRIASLGGMDNVIKMILDGDLTPGSDVNTMIFRTVFTSPEFKKLSVDDRAELSDILKKKIDIAYAEGGTETGRALAARRLGILNVNDFKSIQAHVNAIMAKIDKMEPDLQH